MNILVIGSFYTDAFALHISETLQDMGHSVIHFEPGARVARIPGKIGHRLDQFIGAIYNLADSLPSFRTYKIKSLWRLIENSSFDLVIVCYDYLWPKEVDEIKRRTQAKIVLWFPDAISNFKRGFFINANYDALFFKDPFILDVFKDVLPTPVYYLPEAFNPKLHRPIGKSEDINFYECDVTTAGNLHSWRVACMQDLRKYNVKIWGNPPPLWMNIESLENVFQKIPVHNDRKAHAFLGAKIVLNHLHYSEVWGVNARCFEAAGIGAFQMISWRPNLKDVFEDGKELISFKTNEELMEKIDFWLPRSDERRKIAEAGKKRALAEHTYRHRLQLLIDTAFGQAKGFIKE